MAKIELRGIEVSYPVFSAGRQESLFSNVLTRASFGLIGRSSMATTEVKALRGISFTLNDGDRLGIIGANGSGKTTLLSTLAGITWPQSGYMDIQGEIASLITIGAGLDAERTGYENIDFICKLFGLSKEESKEIAKDIAEFTQLGEFLNLPVRTYSSGMAMRLNFAVATSIPGDILIVDEVLGAGDAAFQVRAAARTNSRYKDTRIFVMATHSPGALVEYCNYCIWLDRGQVVDHGEPKAVWARYAAGTPRGQQFSSTAAARPVEAASAPAGAEATAPAAVKAKVPARAQAKAPAGAQAKVPKAEPDNTSGDARGETTSGRAKARTSTSSAKERPSSRRKTRSKPSNKKSS